MPKIIDLNKPDRLPEEFVAALKRINYLCVKYEFSEELVKHREVVSLVSDLNSFCLENYIIGVHYTRASQNRIRSQGLLIRSGEEIRAEFLKDFGHMFSESEIVTIKERWSNYFLPDQSRIRDGRLFFNFTKTSLNNGGAEPLLGLYGGEQVSICFRRDCSIGSKLAYIGEPVMVCCSLNPNIVSTFIEYPWGKILVSSYHLSVNTGAYGIDQDGYQSVPVTPDNIVEIIQLSKENLWIISGTQCN
ncbi:hypothetical protein F6V25_10670 [Oryzomonas japonica]|uniref:Uncharacterized protein n=1 Tax=Oryzomonas japonica TaxID=2603858 RepID=A0A7J4ZQI2_9BACT|nr:hypothetical protein [Oryzomonas japonica]KAB0665079.1 hypothetical protein F6V25_10670 [Oryzomonas japonica]